MFEAVDDLRAVKSLHASVDVRGQSKKFGVVDLA
jgi:hypothetical protein